MEGQAFRLTGLSAADDFVAMAAHATTTATRAAIPRAALRRALPLALPATGATLA